MEKKRFIARLLMFGVVQMVLIVLMISSFIIEDTHSRYIEQERDEIQATYTALYFDSSIKTATVAIENGSAFLNFDLMNFVDDNVTQRDIEYKILNPTQYYDSMGEPLSEADVNAGKEDLYILDEWGQPQKVGNDTYLYNTAVLSNTGEKILTTYLLRPYTLNQSTNSYEVMDSVNGGDVLKLAFNHVNRGNQMFFIDDETNGTNSLKTVVVDNEAADVSVIAATDGYNLQVNDKYLNVSNGEVTIGNSPSIVWTFDEELQTFVYTDSSNQKYLLGTEHSANNTNVKLIKYEDALESNYLFSYEQLGSSAVGKTHSLSVEMTKNDSSVKEGGDRISIVVQLIEPYAEILIIDIVVLETLITFSNDTMEIFETTFNRLTVQTVNVFSHVVNSDGTQTRRGVKDTANQYFSSKAFLVTIYFEEMMLNENELAELHLGYIPESGSSNEDITKPYIKEIIQNDLSGGSIVLYVPQSAYFDLYFLPTSSAGKILVNVQACIETITNDVSTYDYQVYTTEIGGYLHTDGKYLVYEKEVTVDE